MYVCVCVCVCVLPHATVDDDSTRKACWVLRVSLTYYRECVRVCVCVCVCVWRDGGGLELERERDSTLAGGKSLSLLYSAGIDIWWQCQLLYCADHTALLPQPVITSLHLSHCCCSWQLKVRANRVTGTFSYASPSL